MCDGAVAGDPVANLEWAAGAQADSHDVYFGTSTPLGIAAYRGNHAATSFDPGSLLPDSTYFWRVDEVNAAGKVRGCTWGFTTQGEPAELIFSDDFE